MIYHQYLHRSSIKKTDNVRSSTAFVPKIRRLYRQRGEVNRKRRIIKREEPKEKNNQIISRFRRFRGFHRFRGLQFRRLVLSSIQQFWRTLEKGRDIFGCMCRRGPPQRRLLVVDNKKLSMTKHLVCESSYRLQIMKNKVVDNKVVFLYKRNLDTALVVGNKRGSFAIDNSLSRLFLHFSYDVHMRITSKFFRVL